MAAWTTLATLLLCLGIGAPAHAAGVFGWGEGTFGQLGNGLETESDLPAALSGVSAAGGVAAGEQNSYVLRPDGTVLASGSNIYGQLGDGLSAGPETCGGMPCSLTPVPVSGLEGVTAISARGRHALALLEDGHVMAWGSQDKDGTLGDGTYTGPESCIEIKGNTFGCSRVPVEVSGLSGIKAIAAGGYFNLALREDGHVMAWGDNGAGELGNGKAPLETCVAQACSTVPVEVPGLSGVTAIAAGRGFALALLENGHAMIWGAGVAGAVKGEEKGTTVPGEVPGMTGITGIGAGETWPLLIGPGGSVTQRRLGVEGFEGEYSSVSGISEAVAVTGGIGTRYALLADGELVSWGSDEHGELGYGYREGFAQTAPRGVCSLAAVTGVAAEFRHAIAATGEETGAPVLTAISHHYGPRTGVESVVLSGRHLTEATAVHFGADSVPFKVLSDEAVEAVAPAESEEVLPTVTSPAGTSFSCGGVAYEPLERPYVRKVSIKTMPDTGGTSVTLEGGLMAEVSEVLFGSTPAASFTANEMHFSALQNYGKVTAVSPAMTAGKVTITVVGAGGSGSSKKVKIEPVLTGISPASGPLGGAPVTIKGVGFATGTTAEKFKFGSVKAKVYNCPTSTECVVQAPERTTPGTVPLTVQVNTVKATTTPSYTYE